MHPLLRSVFQSMNREEIPYCLLRDYDELETAASVEVDLLVAKEGLTRLKQLLSSTGFVQLRAWGHEPHHFFLAYDDASDNWLKLDIVTGLIYGHPVKHLKTTLAADCLRNRQQRGFVYTLAPEDELVTLLLHCLLDKGCFAPRHRARLQTLCRQVTDTTYLLTLLGLYWQADASQRQLAVSIGEGNWAALLAQRPQVSKRLQRHDWLGAATRYGYGRLLRKLGRWYGWLKPTGAAVALLAPDGAGKSTVAGQLQSTFYFPVRAIYMGLYGSDSVRRSKLPGLGYWRRLLRQWWRYLRARYEMAQGRWVIFDRYNYDALLSSRATQPGLRRWAYWLLAYACPAPDLTLLLDAPGQVLYSRKGEQNECSLEGQRQQYLLLAHRLPRLIVVDATESADRVRCRITALMWRSYHQT